MATSTTQAQALDPLQSPIQIPSDPITTPTTTTPLPSPHPTLITPLHPPHPPPPPPLTITPLTPPFLPSYRRLLSLLLPIPYSTPFFSESLPPSSPSIALLAHWAPPSPSSPKILIGAIQARISRSNSLHPTLYIQTLALLAPYRHLGIASHLLSTLIARALEREPALREVWAHVWEANAEALEWYVKRGFGVEEGVVGGYYRRLRPAGARVVRMGVGAGGGGEGEGRDKTGEEEVVVGERGEGG